MFHGDWCRAALPNYPIIFFMMQKGNGARKVFTEVTVLWKSGNDAVEMLVTVL